MTCMTQYWTERHGWDREGKKYYANHTNIPPLPISSRTLLQMQPGLQCLHNTFKHVGLLSGNSKMHSLHICHILSLSLTHLSHCTWNQPTSLSLPLDMAKANDGCHLVQSSAATLAWNKDGNWPHVHCYVMLKDCLWKRNYGRWHSKSNILVQQQNRFTWCKLHNILEEPAAPILSSTNMGEAGASRMLVLTYQNTRHHTPEILILHG